jgi:hypothetical protein
MSAQLLSDNRMKRAQTLQGVDRGRDQLLFTSLELQPLGRKFCDETELLPLLLSHGLIRRVRTIKVEVRPLGGDSFEVALEASKSTVHEAKVEIARWQGTTEVRQELYRVAERADGLAVREDDAEPEFLEDASMVLEDGDVVAMAVKDPPPLLWQTFPADLVNLSDGGAVATHIADYGDALTTTGMVLSEGRHYWEVELLSDDLGSIMIGTSRPNLDHTGDYYDRDSTDGWFMYPYKGNLWGNGKHQDDTAGPYEQGDRVGMLLDLDDCSLRFFKNGVEHGPGYPAGSVTGPVVHAVQMYSKNESVRLLLNAEAPAGV